MPVLSAAATEPRHAKLFSVDRHEVGHLADHAAHGRRILEGLLLADLTEAIASGLGIAEFKKGVRP